jgi:two-component system response regulator AtoC
MITATSGAEATLTSAWFESMDNPMLLCDRSLVVLAANRAATGLLAIPSGDLVRRKVDEVLAPVAPMGPVPVPPPPARLEWRAELLTASGDRRALVVSGIPLCDQATGAEGWAVYLQGSTAVAALPEFIGRSGVSQELLEFVSRLAASRATSILLVGESGTGKELIAKRLHALSPRAGAPLVPINCAALPEALLESELFGHEKGAFTGAGTSKEGLLEFADRGTVLLDEIGEMPMPLQAKLLRVLEDHTFRRVGGSRNISVDIRVIAATNTNLERAIEERRFRSDLYYRLNCVQIRVPALRERLEDLPDLIDFFLNHFNRIHNRQIQGVHPNARMLLEGHSWPGNVRELRNVMERAVLVETSSLITTASLALQGGSRTRSLGLAEEIEPPARYCLLEGERELIGAALAEAGGNQCRAAALLGIGRFALRYKMKKLGMLKAS